MGRPPDECCLGRSASRRFLFEGEVPPEEEGAPDEDSYRLTTPGEAIAAAGVAAGIGTLASLLSQECYSFFGGLLHQIIDCTDGEGANGLPFLLPHSRCAGRGALGCRGHRFVSSCRGGCWLGR